jgi:lipid A 3-O-deacylase
MKNRFALPLAIALLAGTASATAAEFSGALGVTGQGDMNYRAGLAFDWDKTWLNSDNGHLSGYWDAAYTYWEGDDYAGAHSLSFAPVFVYEFNGFKYTPFVEGGCRCGLLLQNRCR